MKTFKYRLLLVASAFVLASCGEQTPPSNGGETGDSSVFTITFDSLGGSPVEALKVNCGELATKPKDPTKEGYAFDGWFQDEICKTVFDFSSVKITADWTLYAGWTESTLPPAPSTSETKPVDPPAGQTKKIYFKDPAWWATDKAYTSIHYWDASGKGTAWPGMVCTLVNGTEVNPKGGNIWSFDLDLSLATGGFIFCRHNSDPNATANRDWGAKTPNLTIAEMGENNLFDGSASEMIWGDPGITGAWTTYKA